MSATTRGFALVLGPFRQAVLVLRWFRERGCVHCLARDAGISQATGYRYLHEGIDTLADQAPDLHKVVRRCCCTPVLYGKGPSLLAMRLLVDAILFDIDGTLVDSTAAVTRTWRIWAARHGIDVEEVLRVCHGRRTEDTVALFLSEDERDGVAAELEKLELNDMEGIVALPGARALLSRLPAARWAAVTSGSQALMRARLTAAGLPIPDVLIAGEDVTAGKPDPEGYRKAALKLGCDITQCLVVEDAPAGIEAGRSSGAHTVAVATSHDALHLVHAETVIPELTALTVEQTTSCLVVNITA